MRLFDSHCHLNDEVYEDDLDEVIKRAEDEGVERIVVVGYDLDSSKKAIELSEKYDFIYASIGLHPHDSTELTSELLDAFRKLGKHEKVVAVGETGLDYFKMYSPRDAQKEAFKEQIKLANELELPLILHIRKAFPDVFEILDEIKPEKGAVMHCFSGGRNEALYGISKGFYISFSGSLTFSKKLKEFVKDLPLDKILIETDAPYLTPHPYRGRRNEPRYIKYIAMELSYLLDRDIEEVAEITYRNASKFFALPF